jgi:predicted amidophosphoribosyltransferase
MNWNPKNRKKVQFVPVPPPPMLKLMPSAPKQIRCPNCNAPVRPNQRQCEYCGSWFEVPEVEQITLYADGKPFEIVERVNDFMTRDEARRMYLNE